MKWIRGAQAGLLAFALAAGLLGIWLQHLSRWDQTVIWAVWAGFVVAWALRRRQVRYVTQLLAESENELAKEAARAARMREFIEAPRWPAE